MRRFALVLAFLLVASGCSRRYERPVNGWCKVRVREPVHLGGGMIQAGPDERDTVFVRDRGPGRWRDVAEGTGGSVARLADDRAVLFVPSLGVPGVLITPEGLVKPLAEAFPCEGFRTFSTDGNYVDCGRCTEGAADTCRAVTLERSSVAGGGAESAAIEAPDASCRFRRPGVSWYDHKGRAYLLAACESGARVLFRTGLAGDPEKFTDPKGNENAKTWYQAIGRFELFDPKAFHPVRGRENEPIPR